MVYKGLHGSAPLYIYDLLTDYTPIRPLRSSDGGFLVVLRIRSGAGKCEFSYCRPALWNALPDELRSIKTVSTFKAKLKTFLFSQAHLQCKCMSLLLLYICLMFLCLFLNVKHIEFLCNEMCSINKAALPFYFSFEHTFLVLLLRPACVVAFKAKSRGDRGFKAINNQMLSEPR